MLIFIILISCELFAHIVLLSENLNKSTLDDTSSLSESVIFHKFLFETKILPSFSSILKLNNAATGSNIVLADVQRIKGAFKTYISASVMNSTSVNYFSDKQKPGRTTFPPLRAQYTPVRFRLLCKWRHREIQALFQGIQTVYPPFVFLARKAGLRRKKRYLQL